MTALLLIMLGVCFSLVRSCIADRGRVGLPPTSAKQETSLFVVLALVTCGLVTATSFVLPYWFVALPPLVFVYGWWFELLLALWRKEARRG